MLLEPYDDELKTMPGLRMPRADECLRREFQSLLSDDELLFLSDMVEGAGESLVLMAGGGESDCLIRGDCDCGRVLGSMRPEDQESRRSVFMALYRSGCVARVAGVFGTLEFS